MNNLKLHICDYECHTDQDLSPPPGGLSTWVRALPMGDAATAAAHLFNLVHKYNQCELDPVVRFEALESLKATVTQSCGALCSKYKNSALPLSERNRQRFHLSCGLFDQMAIGYKTVVLDLYNNSSKNQKLHELFLKAIHNAIKQLASLLLECYIVYAKEPDDVWGELNQLYELSESLGASKLVLNKEDKQQTATQTIQYAYLRIALLSVANPYHLMQGEATVLYDYLKNWAMGCQLQKVTDYNSLKNDLVVIEFNRAIPPQFFYEGRLLDIENTRTIDLSNLLSQFSDTLAKMSDYLASDAAHNTFSERMRRDMLLRIQRAWRERQTRKHRREKTNEYLVLAIGLNVSHHFINDQHEYTPEKNEIRFYKPDGINSESITGQTNVTDLEFWQKLHNHAQHAVLQNEPAIQNHKQFRWMLYNQSETGIGLRRDGICDSCVHVGDIVSYKKSIDVAGWHIGVVRWIKEFDKHVLELGINIIKGVARAVSVRSVDENDNTTYVRCLLLELHSRGQSYVNLITPGSIFDVGSQVLINSQDQMQYVKLSDLVTTTPSYSQFEFEIIPTPEAEQIKINTILDHE